MSTIEESIEVYAPAADTYEQWTRFEEFLEKWEAQITEERPGECVAWSSTSGEHTSGTVTFRRTSPDSTCVVARIEVEAETHGVRTDHLLAVLERRIRSDLERFKQQIESHVVAPRLPANGERAEQYEISSNGYEQEFESRHQ